MTKISNSGLVGFQTTDGQIMVGRPLRPRRTEEAPTATPSPSAPVQPVKSTAPVAPAPSFATRLRAILDLAEASKRQQQAIALAVETTATVDAARTILAGLPADDEAAFGPGSSLFGSSAPLDAEGKRISAIVRSTEAVGRERAALELAVKTDLPAAQVRALLAKMPKVAALPTIAERAALEAEFGGQGEAMQSKAERIEEMRAKSIAKINAQFEGKT